MNERIGSLLFVWLVGIADEDSPRASLVATGAGEGGGLSARADESSGISWESTEVALRRLQDENGEDTMTT